MADLNLPSKTAIRDAIAPDTFTGQPGSSRNFTHKTSVGDPIKVFFLGAPSYSEAQIAAAGDPNIAQLNATFQSVRAVDRQRVLHNSFGAWARLAKIDFVVTANMAEADIRVGVGSYNGNSVNVIVPKLDGSGTSWNDVYIATSRYNPANVGGSPVEFFSPGRVETGDLLHEVGHAIGLQHPAIGQDGGTLAAGFNRLWFNAMSNRTKLIDGFTPTTPMLMDAVGLEAIYGLRPGLNAGNTTHRLDSAGGLLSSTSGDTTGKLIYDTGGVDTLTSEYLDERGVVVVSSKDAEIDLRKGHFSSINLSSKSLYNVAIWYDSDIENAKGGSGKDTLIGNDLANRLEGGAGEDTYHFNGSWGKDTVIDSDGKGSLQIDGKALTTFRGDGKRNGFHFDMGGGVEANLNIQQSGNSYIATIVKGTDTANTITINNFNLTEAKGERGYLGIKIVDKAEPALMQGSAANSFWSTLGASLADLAGRASEIIEGAGQTFTVFLSTAAKAGDTLTLAMGAQPDQFKAILGDRTVPANGATITLAEGQTQVSFALVQDGALNADAASTLKVNYSGAGDGNTATSNTWGLTLKDTGDIEETLTGDITVSTDTANSSITRGWPAKLIIPTGGQVYETDGTKNLVADANGSLVTDNTLYGSDDNDAIDGLTGNDLLSGGKGNDQIDGGDGNDMIAGGTGSDDISGGDGDDYISSGADADTDRQQRGPTDQWTSWGLPSGKTVVASGATWGVYLNNDGLTWDGIQATDTQTTDGDVVDAGAGNDQVYASWAADRVQGGDGNDGLYGLAGDDILEGDAGDDLIVADGLVKPGYLNTVAAQHHGNDFADGGEGNDQITGSGGADDLFGGAGNDVLVGDSDRASDDEGFVDLAYHGSDYLDGEDGNDTLQGSGGSDMLYGGAGADRLWGDQPANNLPSDAATHANAWGQDYLDGEDGDDELTGGGNNDSLYGGQGDDRLWGDESDPALPGDSNGADYLDGEAGNDQLVGGGKDDRLFGGSGADVLVGDDAEHLLEGELHGNDYLDGEDDDDAMAGGGKDDVLMGGAGNDTLLGDDSADNLWGVHHGNDTLDGGDGDDLMLGGGRDDVLAGGAGDDVLWGDADDVDAEFHGNDVLEGGDGNDQLSGGGGNDALQGGAGNDTLWGGDGNDTLDGGAGSNTLLGGDGNDTYALQGAAGTRIVDTQGSNRLQASGTLDTVTLALASTVAGMPPDMAEGSVVLNVGGVNTLIDGALMGKGVQTVALDSGETLSMRQLIGSYLDTPLTLASTPEGGNGQTLQGGKGVDQLRAGAAYATILSGGRGDDVITLVGSYNTLYFERGDGRDSLVNQGSRGNELVLGEGISLQDVALVRSSTGQYSLSLGAGDALVLSGEPIDLAGDPMIGTITQADGEHLEWSDLVARGVVLQGTDQDDTLTGSPVADVLEAGLGHNTLLGGLGADVYRIAAGSTNLITDTEDANVIEFAGFEGTAAQLAVAPVSGAPGNVRITLADGTWAEVQGALLQANRFSVRLGDGSLAPLTSLLAGSGTPNGLRLTGTDEGDVINGGNGDDMLLGLEGDDTLQGGPGADVLAGGDGDDTYVVNAGDGAAYVLDPLGRNVLRLGAGLSTQTLSVQRPAGSDDLVLSFGDGTTVHIGGGMQRAIGQFVFAGGPTLQFADLLAFVDGGATTVAGDDTDNDLAGTAGDDTLLGNGGRDTLQGHGGADVLDGGADNDLLTGGRGNDVLRGGNGDDRYRFAQGDGQDLIDDLAGSLTLQLGAGIALQDLVCTRETLDGAVWLRVAYGGGDHVSIKQGPSPAGLRLELADGTVLDRAGLLAVALDESTVATGSAGNDVVYGFAGADTLSGGAGDDTLRGGMGRDTYLMEPGQGQDVVQDFDSGPNVIRALADSAGALQLLQLGSSLLIRDEARDSRLVVDDFFSSQRPWQLQLADGSLSDLRALVAARATPTGADAEARVAQRREAFFSRLSAGTPALLGRAQVPGQWTDEQGNEFVTSGSVTRNIVVSNDSVLQASGSRESVESEPVFLRTVVTTGERTRTRIEFDETTVTQPGRPLVLGVIVGGVFVPAGAQLGYSGFSPTGDLTEVLGPDGIVSVVVQTPDQTTVTRTSYEVTTTEPYTTSTDLYRYQAVHELRVDDVRAGPGNNHITLSGSSVLVTGGSGNDTVQRLADANAPPRELGAPGEPGDFVDGGAGDDVIVLGAGDDELSGGAGNDHLDGNAGSDTYVVSADDDGWDVIVDRALDRAEISLNIYAYGGASLGAYEAAFRQLTGRDPEVQRSTYFDSLQDTGTFEVTRANALAYARTIAALGRDNQATQNAGWDYRLPLIFGSANDSYPEARLTQMLTTGEVLDSDLDAFLKLGGARDVVRFGAGIRPDQLQVRNTTLTLDDGSTTSALDISWGGPGGIRVAVDDAQDKAGFGIERFEFEDGQVLTRSAMAALAVSVPPVVPGDALQAQQATEDALFSWTIPAGAFETQGNVALAVSVTLADGSPLPSWLTFDADQGRLYGTPDNAQVGALQLMVQARAGDAVAQQALQLSVANVNDAPQIAQPAAGIALEQGQTLSWQAPAALFSDMDAGDTLSWAISLADGEPLPAWLEFNAGTRTLSGTAPNQDAGEWTLRVQVTDAAGATASQTFTLTLTEPGGIDLVGTAEADDLVGTAGNDTIDGLGGADTMTGLQGNDTFAVDNTRDRIVEQALGGMDLVNTRVSYTLPDHVENMALLGTANLRATGNALSNVLQGNSGANRLDGGLGSDQMAGGAGNDVYVVDNAADTAVELAGEGTDTVLASVTHALGANVERLTLTGTAAVDGTGNELANILTGNAEANTLRGLGGNDSLRGGLGADQMLGGAGNDSYLVDDAGDVVVELADEGTDTVQASVSFVLGEHVERLTLTGLQALNGTGNDLDNIVTGNAGANVLQGLAGNDALRGGLGADQMEGGLGNDSYTVDDAGDVVVEHAGEGTDTVQASVSYVLGDNQERLTLTGLQALNGTGNALDNIIAGNAADNLLSGLEGADTLRGGNGADTLSGGAGNDRLEGGAGGDTYLFGRGDGLDTLVENDATPDALDVLRFGEGIGAAQIWLRKQGNHLDISVIGTSDRVRVNNWFAGEQYRVESLELASGQRLAGADVNLLVQAMASFAPPPAGQTTLAPNYQNSLGSVIAANWL